MRSYLSIRAYYLITTIFQRAYSLFDLCTLLIMAKLVFTGAIHPLAGLFGYMLITVVASIVYDFYVDDDYYDGGYDD